jgi:3'-5' exonuclease
MIDKIDITDVLFLDIETVSGCRSYEDLTPAFQKLWKLKVPSILKQYDEPITEEIAAKAYVEKAGIFAEFGKIICISVGIVVRNAETGSLHVRLKSFEDHDEKKLLQDFSDLVSNYYSNTKKHFLCGHNLKEFDVPYICRRMLINQMPLPRPLDISGLAPWELKHLLDTMAMWRFGDFKNYTALKLLCECFGVPSPKDDIDGSDVGRVYWEEDDLHRIAVYCEKDVLAVVQLLLRYKRQPLLEGSQITFVGR